MGFITPCFVCVDDTEERIELENIMRKLGYKVLASNEQEYLVADPKGSCMWMGLEGKAHAIFARDYHDCGTDIHIFLTLAAMRDDTDEGQCFVCKAHGIFFRCHTRQFKTYIVEWEDGETNIRQFFERASAEEIIEHFKNLKK